MKWLNNGGWPFNMPPVPRLVPAAPYHSAPILYLGIKSSDASDAADQFIRLSFGYIMKFQIGSDSFSVGSVQAQWPWSAFFIAQELAANFNCEGFGVPAGTKQIISSKMHRMIIWVQTSMRNKPDFHSKTGTVGGNDFLVLQLKWNLLLSYRPEPFHACLSSSADVGEV